MLIIDITNSTAHSFSPSSIEDWKKVFTAIHVAYTLIKMIIIQ